MKIFPRTVIAVSTLTLLAACAGAEEDAPSETAQAEATGEETEEEDPGSADTEASEEEGPVELIDVSMSVLESPSLTYFLVPIIEDLGFDEANGLSVEFLPKPVGTMRTDFASGSDQVTGGGTILADVARLSEEGAETYFLFNVFDYWGALVSDNDDPVETISAIEGRSLGASLPTTNYAMFEALAAIEGVDLSGLNAENSQPGGLGTLMSAGRVDAVQIWEPAHSILLANEPGRYNSLDLAQAWVEQVGQEAIPYIGVAAQREWADENPEAVQRLFAMYQDFAQFVEDEPDRAAELISADTGIDQEVLAELLSSDRFGTSVYATSTHPEAFEAVFQASVDSGYLESMPGDEVLYAGLD